MPFENAAAAMKERRDNADIAMASPEGIFAVQSPGQVSTDGSTFTESLTRLCQS